MPRAIHRALAAVVLLLGPVAAAVASGPPVTLYLKADIIIEPDGSLSRLDWQHADKLPAVLRDRIERHVATWAFEPGAVDGRPGRTESSLSLTLEAADAGGALALRVMDAKTGARLMEPVFPQYPREGLYSGKEAAVLARFEAGPDGERTVHIDGYAGDKRLRRTFTDAVEAMFDGVEVRYELVDGRPVPATFEMPVTFCIDTPDCHEDAFADTRRATAGQPGAPVPVASVARLVTDVRGAGI